ncbi:hypothetical protein [Oleiharenicola sp. Vm1]|uniref:hypothetical protein n=1 Tax=Oleiharenicola sp. Vm1 TaxID=3398393 RepID=UPI0039F4B856
MSAAGGKTGSGGSMLTDLVREAATGAAQDGAPAAPLSMEQRAALEAEFRRKVEEAFQFYEKMFPQMPSMENLRKLWKERQVTESDPIWLMADVLALYDTRGQLVLSQIVRILRSSQDLSQFTIDELRGAIETATKLQMASADAGARADVMLQRMADFAVMMEKYNREVPTLLNAMYRATQVLDTRSQRAIWELAGIVAAAMTAGGIVALLLRKFFFS